MPRETEKTKPAVLEWTIAGVALLMIIYHMLSVWYPLFNALLHQNIHLGFAFVLLFLTAMRTAKTKAGMFNIAACLVALFVVVYMHVNQERLDMWAGFPEPHDVVVGIVLVLLVFYLTWKVWGPIFPILVSISIAYALFGHHVPGALGHPPFDPKLVLSKLGIGFSGIYGMMLNASANLIFLFIIFGGMFEAVGIDKFFIEIGTFLGRRLKGGSAQTAVFSSSFVGMCTGAAAANVALTGSYTIPLMKKTGFTAEHAGAIEAVASTGGQLTPPIMGVAIFLMASFLGVTYSSLMATALIPAVFYYLTAMIGVILISSKMEIPMLQTKVDRAVLLRGLPVFVIPMGLVTGLLVMHYTPAYSAFVAIFTLLAVSMVNRHTRPSARVIVQSVTRAAVMGATIALACASIGMFTSMLTFTGAGPKLAGLIAVLSAGHLLPALFFTMVLSIILGCAMPTPVAYVVAALVVAPILEHMGLALIKAHLFVFYFAILSAVTPPVAGAAVVGSRIAEAGYMKTGWEALKLIAPFFLIPYFIIHNPVLMSDPQPLGSAAAALTALLVSWSAFMFFCQGHCLVSLGAGERFLFLITAALAFYSDQFESLAAFILSLFLLAGLFLFQLRGRARLKNPAVRPDAAL